MSERRPKVSIGLPVYNGEQYLKGRLDSLLAQTYEDFELIICDNASTDGTEKICRERASQDRRIKYHRNKENIGGFPNHDLVFHLSRGEYFVWVGVDDYHHPEFVRKCVEVLDSRPKFVICYTATKYIDDHDNEIPGKELIIDVENPDLRVRFSELIRLDHVIEPVMGLYRSELLRKTRLMPTYPDSDRVMVAELGLYGPFHRIPEPLFSRRAGDEHSTAQFPSRHERMRWIDPRNPRNLVFPYNRQVIEFVHCLRRAPISWSDRVACLGILAKWCWSNFRLIASDYRIAGYDILRPLVRPLLNRRRRVSV